MNTQSEGMRTVIIKAPNYGGYVVYGEDVDGNPSYLVQSDYDYPCLADHLGWDGLCPCHRTDGTVDCEHMTAEQMIESASQWLFDHTDEELPCDNDYYEAMFLAHDE